MPKVLLPVPHQKQRRDGDCLAACAAMMLDYLGLNVPYANLLELLRIKSFGAPASNIRLLEQLSLTVTYRVTNMTELENLLVSGQPVIVFVRTGELPYWHYQTDHALVVVGFDEANVFVNDPYFDDAPITVTRGDFELAWLERDYFSRLLPVEMEGERPYLILVVGHPALDAEVPVISKKPLEEIATFL